MKKWCVLIVLVLGVFLLSSCQKPIDALITYCFVPDSSGAHMFNINSVNQDGSEQQVLLEATDVGFNQPDWTKDGTTMAMWGWHDPETISIYTYNTQTAELLRLTDEQNVYDMFPHWNARDDKIVFTRQYLLENSRNEVWIMNADGTDAKKLVDGYTGSWSPDGKQIVYSHVIDGNEDLYTCNSDGTNVTKLLETPSNESFPMWSPDGKSIMFEQYISASDTKDVTSFEIVVLNIKTGELKPLTQNTNLDIGARWSPDGLKITYLSNANGEEDYEIYVMNADGTQVKQVTQTAVGSFATCPSWRPITEQTKLAKPIVKDPYTRTEQQFGLGRSFDLCKGDFNGDGKLDIFVTTYEGKSGLYLKTSQGYELSPTQFSTPEDNSHGIAAGDLDHDEDLDLFLVNNSANSRVFFNDGEGNFTPSDELYGLAEGRGLNVKLADIDGDGDLDALIANYQRPAQLLINDGLGHFTTSDFEDFKRETIQVLVADFNKDGALDTYFVNHGRHDQIALNDGKGILKLMPELYGESVEWGNASAGDLNGDGYPDVVVTNKELGAGIWLNDKTGKLSKFGDYIGYYCTNVVLEDLDQDGDLDMVIMSTEQGAEVYLNDGLADFTLYKSLENSYEATTSLVMDFDEDGQLDILIARMTGGNLIYYYQ